MTGFQVEDARRQGGRQYGNEQAGYALEALEQKNDGQAAGADGKGVPVGLAVEQGLEQMQRVA
ncbi:hypothetical protein D9M69_660830 [compost metagenome]